MDEKAREARPERERETTDAADPERPPAEPGEGPRAPHGDALRDGSGNRHGVHERDRRPER